jgi:hypothetical protein
MGGYQMSEVKIAEPLDAAGRCRFRVLADWDTEELAHHCAFVEAQVRQLREALECWPLKEILGIARATGNEHMVTLFEEVRDSALAATAPKEQP